MSVTSADNNLGELLQDLAEELEIPRGTYETARERYKKVGEWLNVPGTELSGYLPDVYPQGSQALGTAIKPLEGDHHDVDAVCILQRPLAGLTQQKLKALVGDRLKESPTYARMLSPKDGGRRCWTLEYAESARFHLDILPAVPDDYAWLVMDGVPEDLARDAIKITDKTTWASGGDWRRSNPKGYAAWFRRQMHQAHARRRKVLAAIREAKLEEIPEDEVKTTLQSAVQLLKRHRDMRFAGDDDKPISIIITTLAGGAYGNEDDLFDALRGMIPKLRHGIVTQAGDLWVPNPVNPKHENFADKWRYYPKRKDKFFEWLDSLEALSAFLESERNLEKVAERLQREFGDGAGSAAMKKYAGRRQNKKTISGSLVPRSSRPVSLFNVRHREEIPWPVAIQYPTVRVGVRVHRKSHPELVVWDKMPEVDKRCTLNFRAATNVPEPYGVFWQVVNTGREADDAGCLRGGFYPSPGLFREESTLYSGRHWVQCFIVKDGKVVAMSDEFVVPIR